MDNLPPITTMTNVFPLDGWVNMRAAYELLPITRVTVEPTKRKCKKCKLPIAHRGAIIRTSFGPWTRGVLRTDEDGTKAKWKNGVIIDLSTSDKNVSLKLSSQTIHSAGGNSVANGEEGATLLLQHLRDIQETLDRMKKFPKERDEALRWVSEEVPKDLVFRPSVVLLKERPEIYIIRWKLDSLLRNPTGSLPGLAGEFSRFFLQFREDFLYFSDYWDKIQQILVLDSLISPTLSILDTRIEMANYNYNLGCRINRLALARSFHGRNGFLAQYNNTAGHRVRIVFPLESEENEKKPRRHTFIVTRSGSVTQSGPGEMKEIYRFFLQTFEEIRGLVTRW